MINHDWLAVHQIHNQLMGTTNFANEIMNKEADSKERQTFDLIYNSLAKVYGLNLLQVH